MSEPEAVSPTAWPATPAASWTQALQTLRDQGAEQLDPVRFRFLQALARRADTAPAGVRLQLEHKLQAGVADLGQRLRQVEQATHNEATRLTRQHPELARELRKLVAAGDHQGVRRLAAQGTRPPLCAPLTQLNRHILNARQHPGADEPTGPAHASGQAHGPTELKSAARFRDTWARIHAEEEVNLAVGRGPENAGPLNSHRLVLKTLGLMRDLSPDYLRRFLSQVDSLLWLEQATAKPKPVAGKTKVGKPGRK